MSVLFFRLDVSDVFSEYFHAISYFFVNTCCKMILLTYSLWVSTPGVRMPTLLQDSRVLEYSINGTIAGRSVVLIINAISIEKKNTYMYLNEGT